MSNQDKLIEQEQDKLDQLIRRMDNVLLKIHKDLTRNELKIRKSKAACLPEAYGYLISAQNYNFFSNHSAIKSAISALLISFFYFLQNNEKSLEMLLYISG